MISSHFRFQSIYNYKQKFSFYLQSPVTYYIIVTKTQGNHLQTRIVKKMETRIFIAMFQSLYPALPQSVLSLSSVLSYRVIIYCHCFYYQFLTIITSQNSQVRGQQFGWYCSNPQLSSTRVYHTVCFLNFFFVYQRDLRDLSDPNLMKRLLN